MTAGTKNRDGDFGLAGLEPAVSSPEGPLPGDAISLGDVVALLVSDLGVRRTSAPVDQIRDEQTGERSQVVRLRAR